MTSVRLRPLQAKAGAYGEHGLGVLNSEECQEVEQAKSVVKPHSGSHSWLYPRWRGAASRALRFEIL